MSLWRSASSNVQTICVWANNDVCLGRHFPRTAFLFRKHAIIFTVLMYVL